MNSLQDKGWNSMKQMLDAQMPVGKPGRPIFWWYLAPTLLILLVVAGGIYLWEPMNVGNTVLTEQAMHIDHNNGHTETSKISEIRTTESEDQPLAVDKTTLEHGSETRVPHAIHTHQPAGQSTLESTTPNALQSNASKTAIQKETQQETLQHIKNESAKEKKEQQTETPAEPIAMRPAEADDFAAPTLAMEPLDMKQMEAAPTINTADLAAPAALNLVPLVQNVFQLRGHAGLYIPPGAGISGGSLGLSARFELKSKWGLHGGADLGYLKPFRETDINRNMGFAQSHSNSGQHLSEQNYDAIKNYWLANYYIQASYRPIKPLSMQLGFFHSRQLKGQDLTLITQDDISGGIEPNSVYEALAYQYREKYTGLQAGMFIHLTPRLSMDAQYKLASRSWFASENKRPANLDRGTHMHLFKVGASYRIL